MVPINGEKVAVGSRKWKNKMAGLISIFYPPLVLFFFFLLPISRSPPCLSEVRVTFKIVNPDSETQLKWAMKTEQDGENPVIAEWISRGWKDWGRLFQGWWKLRGKVYWLEEDKWKEKNNDSVREVERQSEGKMRSRLKSWVAAAGSLSHVCMINMKQ